MAGRVSAAAILAVIFSAPPHTADLCAADNSSADLVKDVLDRVPSDAGFFAHGRAGDLWNTPVVKEMRKTIGAEGEKALKGFEKQMGLLAETVETVTFYYPQMPQGDRDVKTFVVVVITNRPYDRTRILNYLWAKDAKEKTTPSSCKMISCCTLPTIALSRCCTKVLSKNTTGVRSRIAKTANLQGVETRYRKAYCCRRT